MKLFVWIDPHPVPYGSSLLFAVAETEEEARRIAKSARAFHHGDILQDSAPNVELGVPARVLDVPCGEWHQWSE
jgi:hypothetical protein